MPYLDGPIISRLRPYDVVYTDYNQLEYFVDVLLPLIQQPVVLIASQREYAPWQPVKEAARSQLALRNRLTEALRTSKFIVHLFATNAHAVNERMSGFPYVTHGAARVRTHTL